MEPSVLVDAAVLEAVQLVLSGHHETARVQLEGLWHSLPQDDGFHRCIIAHYLADIQPEPHDELRWDQAALSAALVSNAESFDNRIPDVTFRSFLPSLHLNLASSYERVGDLDAAKVHARNAWQGARELTQTPIAKLTGSAILRLCARLGVATD
jgi:hypothetical protein